MLDKPKFEHALQHWKHSEKLHHQKSARIHHKKKKSKSLLARFARRIKKLKKASVNFFYLSFSSYKKIGKEKAPLPQPCTYRMHVKTSTKENPQVLAVVIHAFYFDIFIHILEKTASISTPYTLYITTHQGIAQEVSSHMKSLGLDAHIEVYNNKGRDVLPFLKIIDLIKTNGHQVILKLHTKKSPHKAFGGGRIWCDNMVDQLLEKRIAGEAIKNFITYPTLGLIAPSNHLYPLWLKGGINMTKVEELAKKIDHQGDIGQLSFVGGTMFYARVNIFNPLLKLDIKDTDFEEEPIPLDGTLAHVIERAFALAVDKEGLETVDTQFIKSLDNQDAAQKI